MTRKVEKELSMQDSFLHWNKVYLQVNLQWIQHFQMDVNNPSFQPEKEKRFGYLKGLKISMSAHTESNHR